MKLKLKKLDPANITSNGLLGCFVVLIGRRNSGKTTLMKDLIFHMAPRLDIAIGISPTDDTNLSMQTVIPPSFVYREADDKLLLSLMESQRRRWATGKGPELLLVLDDVAWDTAFFNSKAFKQLAFNGRHMHITVILCMQYALCIPPPIRAQVDLCITMSDHLLTNRKKLFEQFFGMMKFEEFMQIMDKSTNGFECLCLWNRSRSNELDTMLFWYLANLEDSENARVGKSAYWKLSEHYGRNTFGFAPLNDTQQQQKIEDISPELGQPIDTIVKAGSDGKTVVIKR